MQVAPSVLGSDWRVIIDKDARLSLLLNAKSEIVAGAKLTSDDPNEVHWRIKRSVCATVNQRLGTTLYLCTLAWLTERGKTLSPDCTRVSDGARGLWRSLWRNKSILKTPLPLHLQSDIHNLELVDDLLLNNTMKQVEVAFFDDPQPLRAALANQHINPHFYNYGYQLSALSEYTDEILSRIEQRVITLDEIHILRTLIKATNDNNQFDL